MNEIVGPTTQLMKTIPGTSEDLQRRDVQDEEDDTHEGRRPGTRKQIGLKQNVPRPERTHKTFYDPPVVYQYCSAKAWTRDSVAAP